MGYDIHITRAEYWAENMGHEITLAEWLDVARSDSRLDPRGDGVVVGEGIRLDGGDAALYWENGDVSATDADENTVQLMRQLAERLGASVQGDDGEHY